MVREIKTTLALDGEKAFNAALREAEREMRVMNADLKAMAAEYKATDDAQKYFTERNETLNRKIKQQEEIVESLSRAVKESADKFGEAGATTDGYRIKLSNATAKLFDMRREAEEAARELEDLGRDSEKVGRQLERGIGDAAEDVEDKLDGMFDKVASDVEGMKSSLDFSVAMDIGGGIKDFITGIDDFAESSRDYRRSLSFLEQNAMTFGIEFMNVKELMFEMASITGEVDSSVEALSNLMAAGFDATEMSTAVDLLAGAVIRFPDTLKFESLADGLQETLATGQATGQYAELLERLGVNLDDFNAGLASAKDAEEQQQIALAYLVKHGLKDSYDSYLGMHGEITKAEEATLRLNDATAALGEALDYILAPGKMFVADVLQQWAENAKKNAHEIEGIFDDPEGTVFNREWWQKDFQEKYPEFAEKIGIGVGTETTDAFYNSIIEEGSQKLPSIFEDPNLQIDYTPVLNDAETAGKNVSISIANGVAEESPRAVQNVMDMVDQMNEVLNMIAVPNPMFGNIGINNAGAGGIYMPNISLDIDGQTAGRLLYDGVSEAGGRAVQTRMIVK